MPPRARGSYTFEYNTPPEAQDSDIDQVHVSGSFNDWRPTKLQRISPGVWQAKLTFSFPVDCRYFIYLYHIIRVPVGENAGLVGRTEDVVDWSKPVFLQEGMKPRNYLDIAQVSKLDTLPAVTRTQIPRTEGNFTFCWPERYDSDIQVSVIIHSFDGVLTEHQLQQCDEGWDLTTSISVPRYESTATTKYWYLVKGQRRYNASERMGRDSQGEDCNILLAHDLDAIVQDQKAHEDPVHAIYFTASPTKLGSPPQVRFYLDGWIDNMPMMPQKDNPLTFSLSLNLACPVGTKVFYEAFSDDAWRGYRCDPYDNVIRNKKECYLNFYITGRPWNTLTSIEAPLVGITAPGVTETGRYKFVLHNRKPSTSIWVLGTFNNWTKSETCKLKTDSRTTRAVHLSLPIQRHIYKYVIISDAEGKEEWVIDPLARVEPDPKDNQLVNYLLPEDITPTGNNTSFKPRGVASGICITGERPLSPKATEALGM